MYQEMLSISIIGICWKITHLNLPYLSGNTSWYWHNLQANISCFMLCCCSKVTPVRRRRWRRRTRASSGCSSNRYGRLHWWAVVDISMGWCKKDVTPLLTHWNYVFLALTHWYIIPFLIQCHKLLSSKLWHWNSSGTLNSLWPSDAIWRMKSLLTLAQVPDGTKPLPVSVFACY